MRGRLVRAVPVFLGCYELYPAFRAVAELVSTAAARLHVRRMPDASGVDAPAFTDEAAALASLSSA